MDYFELSILHKKNDADGVLDKNPMVLYSQ